MELSFGIFFPVFVSSDRFNNGFFHNSLNRWFTCEFWIASCYLYVDTRSSINILFPMKSIESIEKFIKCFNIFSIKYFYINFISDTWPEIKLYHSFLWVSKGDLFIFNTKGFISKDFYLFFENTFKSKWASNDEIHRRSKKEKMEKEKIIPR